MAQELLMPNPYHSNIHDLLLEKKLNRILAARVYADSLATALELEAQYKELLKTAPAELQERMNATKESKA
jgi:hypothetical protein